MKKLSLQPLIFVEQDLLCYRGGSLYLIDPLTLNKIWSIKLNLGHKEKWLSRIGPLRRLLRLGIRNTFSMGDKIMMFVNKRFYEFNLKTKILEAGFIPPTGIRALNISIINNVSGFDDMMVFGGYLSNPDKNEVSIYKYINKDKWEPVFTFPNGEINHIHNIIPDPYNRCVWIQTGDFGAAAATWMAKDNFQNVSPVLRGEQSARGCVAFPTEKGLVYATDTPLADNSIRILEKSDNEWKSKELCSLPGSCIYATQIGDKYVFATTVEPSGTEGGIKGLISTKPGPGIKDKYVHLFIGNVDNGFREIYKVKKDALPYALFQFGSFQFPSGHNPTNNLFVYHTSTIKNEGKTIVIPLK